MVSATLAPPWRRYTRARVAPGSTACTLSQDTARLASLSHAASLLPPPDSHRIPPLPSLLRKQIPDMDPSEASPARRVRVLADHVSPRAPTHDALVPNPTAASKPRFTVAVLGAAGGIGQPLSLLLKQSPLVSALHLYDVANVAGVAADLSHVNSNAVVRGFHGPTELSAALAGADLVVIPAGVPRKPGMTRDDLFAINAGIVRDLVSAAADACPNAILNIISNPVNSTVPIAAEVLRRKGRYDPRRLMGVTHLDVMRARTFVSEAKGLDPLAVDVPVVGGHAGVTILPLLSQMRPSVRLTDDEAARLTHRVQNGGTEVVEAKAGAGSATLSMAAAAAQFASACLRAMAGERGVVECAYVASDVTKLPFFASKVRLGKNGVERVLGLGRLSASERAGLEKLAPELEASIAKGVAFVEASRHARDAPAAVRSAGGFQAASA